VIEKTLKSEKILELHQALQNQDSILIEELWNSPKALIASLAQRATGKHILILTGASVEETKLYHDFAIFTDRPVVDYPAWETLPSENIAPSPDIVGERYQVINKIISSSQPHIIISSLSACLQKLISPTYFQLLHLTIKVRENTPFEKLIESLVENGYRRCPVAGDKGEFAVRGGIIDVFPVSSPDPFRIEFWGDEVESIRIYDPIGQKTVQKVNQIDITPALEMEFLGKENHLATIFDYLGPQTLVIFDDLLSLEDRYASLVGLSEKPSSSFSSIEAFLNQANALQKIFWTEQPIEELTEVVVNTRKMGGYYSESAPMHDITFQMFQRKLHAKRWHNPFLSVPDYLLSDKPSDEAVSGNEILLSLNKLPKDNCELYLLSSSESEKNNLRTRISDAAIHLPAKTHFDFGYLSSGFVLHDINLVVLPMAEITQRYKIRRQKQRSTYHTAPSEAFDLTPGEIVVHFHNGIGKYLGIEKRPNNVGIESEFLLVEYAEDAKLYVPMNQAHLISKYIGSNESLPKMHSLGSTKWKKTREATERAILGYAADLLQLYAKREMIGGNIYPADTPDMNAFEDEFPFSETEDQLLAIASIKEDMCSNKAMDRLVCGDVGYGKTEVAMRAAFKAAAEGEKQVAVLVPTTVLAMQHFDNFVDRMRNFPLNIAVLSRFQTSKQIKEALAGIADGSVDIVIGTHRIISDDVVFKNLGLVIIDEEQRFGVRAKEHLKRLKVGVDTLTLSATPIPRTLYMSLIGARDLSVINTPPQDRLPIKTVITEPNDALFKTALLRELTRDGQAFVIHNRVESIYAMADRIKKILPQSRIGVAHGQMHSDEIDQVFHAFKSGAIDILVATSIVENGIDIPNANTILIDRADQFGLADLYQLRGRVGRWNRRAYAYFLIPKQHALPEMTRKRLQALAESSGYGGGMKLAMRDLEIRGAGDILGLEQSGHVASIGFHLYCKLLKRTIKSLEGKMPSIFVETKIDFPMDARLPDTYINEASLRMEIYQRLGEAMAWEEVDEILLELKDRFGPPPLSVVWLIHISRIRVFASQHSFTLLKMEKVSLTTERKLGAKSITRKSLLGKTATPQEFEDKIIQILKSHTE
jgi:transcription-repair coupling factor (superfamily II helicase)